MENQRAIIFDHELEVDGVIYRKLKILYLDVFDAGKDKLVLVHTRYIGDKSCTVKQINDKYSEYFAYSEYEVKVSNMTFLEVATFLENWCKNWNPRPGQQQTGGIKRFFKKLFKF